jgi:putative Mg2+ transporter-C (MgtC) family protein
MNAADIAASIWTTFLQEFSDIPDASEATRIVLRLAMASLLGAAIGYERERRGKAAGLRTHMLVSLGAALFVLIPLQSGMKVEDLSRVMQGVIAGIGFLGAGTIMKLSDRRRVKGLTTAATIWVAAAIGIAAGVGLETTALISTLSVLFILVIIGRMEAGIDPLPSDAVQRGSAAPPPPSDRPKG